MDYTKLFYWLVVADNARTMFLTFVVIFTAISGIATICFIFGRDSDDLTCQTYGLAERSKKWIWFGYPFMILFWTLYLFTPSKKDSLLIVAGGGTLNYLTTDSTAKQIPHELSNFVVTELKNMAKENEIDLNLKEQKQKIIDEAKSLPTDQLLEKLKTDTLYKKYLLDEHGK